MTEPTSDTTDTTAGDSARIAAEILGQDRGTDPFVAAVRATRMPMIITNPRLPDNPVVFANDSFCRLTGYEREEIVGRNCRFLQGSDTAPETVRRLHEAVESVQPLQVDIRNYRKNGEPFWNRLLMAPVRDANGVLAYFFASQVDVSLERGRLEGLESRNAALMAEIGDRLREHADSEERLKQATEAGGIGVWELDIASRSLITSALCRENFGRDASDPFSYEELEAAVHPEDRARMMAEVARSIETGNDYRIEYRAIKPDGTIAWVQTSARVQRDARGRSAKLVGISRDVSEERGATERAEVLNELDRSVFGAVVEPTEIAYLAAKALGQLFDVSRAGYGTINKAEETITIDKDWNAPGIRTLAGTLHFREYGTYIEDLKQGEAVVIDDAKSDPRTSETANALISISAQSFVNFPVHESGDFVALLYLNNATRRHWSTAELAFVRTVANRVRQAVERRRAEHELRALANSLEVQVQERTADLMTTEAALRQSQKMEAVGQLTGGLAHDFNNLLAAISGSLEVVEKSVATGHLEKVDRFMIMARGAVKRAAALTHRLLAFSRRQTLDPKPVNANRLIADMEELIRRTVGPGIHVEVVGAGGLWPALVDASQLENALLNLCINARDAMPDGGRLTIETANKWLDDRTGVERDLPSGQYISVCVTDSGVGMTPEVVAKAFDPFFTTKPLGSGTGLGLSMTYGFARQSGGQVRIYSEVGEGTTVCLYLPRHDAEPAPDVDDPSTTSVSGDGEVILVIDDEPAIRALVVDLLQESGYTALEAFDGPSGLRVLESARKIDLLITDVGLPGGMNGRQVADAARVMRPDLKVLFITGYAENAVVGNGHVERWMSVVSKPFELDMLAARVKEIIGS